MSNKSKTKKSIKHKSIRKRISGNKLVIFVFVLLFAGVGLVLLLRSYAQTPDPILLDQVLVEYQKGGQNTVEHDANGNVLHTQRSTQLTLLKSGELLCNNGSADSVNAVFLASTEVDNIVNTVSKRLNTITKKFNGVPYEGGEISLSPVSIVLADGNGTVLQSVTFDESVSRPPAFSSLENFLNQQCAKATSKKSISSLTPTVAPREKGIAIDITDKVFPTASAATVSISEPAETKSFNMVNTHRATGTNAYGAPWKHPVGKPALKSLPCLKDSARLWSAYLLQNNAFFHSNIGELIPHYCGGGWESLGENLAKGAGFRGDPVQRAEDLTRALLNSLGHHANIDHKFTTGGEPEYQFQELGVGILIMPAADGTYTMQITQHFARYPNK